jgi:predicted MFS family arabinose efflux permease
MNLTLAVGENLNWYGVAMFAAMGYLNGYLFRNINLYKIIALLFVLPFCLELLIGLDNVKDATLPFLIMALVGFFGPARTQQRLVKLLRDARYHCEYFVRRWK